MHLQAQLFVAYALAVALGVIGVPVACGLRLAWVRWQQWRNAWVSVPLPYQLRHRQLFRLLKDGPLHRAALPMQINPVPGAELWLVRKDVR